MIVIGPGVDMEVEDGNSPPLGTPWIGYDNLVQSTNVSSTTADTDNPISNVANAATHLFWRGGVNTALDEFITVATGATSTLNYVGIARHNFGTSGITVTIQGIVSGSSPDVYTTLAGPELIEDDLPLIFRIDPAIYTSIRVRMQNGDDPPEIGVLYAGTLLVMERSIDIEVEHVPLNYGRRATVVSGMSETGNFLGRIVLKEWRESVAVFRHITPAWYRSDFDAFLDAAQEAPFFWAWHPLTYPEETGFAWLTNNPEPKTSPITQRVDIELQMRGIA